MNFAALFEGIQRRDRKEESHAIIEWTGRLCRIGIEGEWVCFYVPPGAKKPTRRKMLLLIEEGARIRVDPGKSV
jgi:hypothetical protein